MSKKHFNKIFCIGLNKTGTSSLHRAFLQLGLSSLHYGPDDYETLAEHISGARCIIERIKTNIEDETEPLQHVDDYDAYSDLGPIVHRFEIFDKCYPGSKFIYTDRDTESWITSRKHHIERNRVAISKADYETKFLDIEPEKWAEQKKIHFQRVMDYFADREDDLLNINICDGEGYEKLCPFLKLQHPTEPFPWDNSALKNQQQGANQGKYGSYFWRLIGWLRGGDSDRTG